MTLCISYSGTVKLINIRALLRLNCMYVLEGAAIKELGRIG